ncbi:hypothetical protein OEA41_002567 [Lepraria neglecta]|uniref:Uncharacterized protein n=1 Tax=Lepraria neglecta TaxID=209136 RepID=A0AAE0DMS4_9LECA|nr:hypothetical protein OEA41_002567 [Lepraria neglecta]
MFRHPRPSLGRGVVSKRQPKYGHEPFRKALQSMEAGYTSLDKEKGGIVWKWTLSSVNGSGKPPVITPNFGGIDVTVYSKRRNYYNFDAGELLYDIKYDEWDGIPNDHSKVLGRIYKATHQYLARKDVQR